MRRARVLLIVIALSLFAIASATAEAGPPGLPAVFYGTVSVGGAAPLGSTVSAYIGEQLFAQVAVQEQAFLGTVYVLDVPADDADTTPREGGINGDTVRFSIEVPEGDLYWAAQQGTWGSGNYLPLDLDAVRPVALPLIIRLH